MRWIALRAWAAAIGHRAASRHRRVAIVSAREARAVARGREALAGRVPGKVGLVDYRAASRPSICQSLSCSFWNVSTHAVYRKSANNPKFGNETTFGFTHNHNHIPYAG